MRLRSWGLSLVLAVGCAQVGTSGLVPGAPAVGATLPAGASLYGEFDVSTLATNPLLQDALLTRYRDRALAFVGLSLEEATRASGPARVFGFPTGASAAYIPGLLVQGPQIRTHRRVPLLARGDRVGARVAGGSVTGDPSAVAAFLDAALSSALEPGSEALAGLVAQGSPYRTVRLASLRPGQILALLPSPPPARLLERLEWASLFATLEGPILYAQLTVKAGDPAASRDLGAWAERERQSLRGQLGSWRDSAGFFGSALDPAISAIDAIALESTSATLRISVQTDLGAIFSSGLFTVLRTLQILSP